MSAAAKWVATPFVLMSVLLLSMPAVLHSYVGVAVRIIRTGSMEPGIHPGDAVLVRAVPATSLAAGDVALLFHPKDDDIEAHRLVSIATSESGLVLVTKGDANPMSDDPVLVPTLTSVERVLFAIPKFGYVIADFGSPKVLGSVCALGLIVLIAIEMQDRRRRDFATPDSITQ